MYDVLLPEVLEPLRVQMICADSGDVLFGTETAGLLLWRVQQSRLVQLSESVVPRKR